MNWSDEFEPSGQWYDRIKNDDSWWEKQTYATSAPKIQYCPCYGVGIMWKFHDDDFKAGWKGQCFEYFLEKLEKQYERKAHWFTQKFCWEFKTRTQEKK